MAWLDLEEGILEEFSEYSARYYLADAFASKFGVHISNAGLNEERRTSGECVDCGKFTGGRARCKTCSKLSDGEVRAYRERKKLIGKCRQCSRYVAPGKTQCAECLSKANTQASSYYEKNKAHVLEKAKEKRKLIAERKKLTRAGSVQ